MLPDLTLTDLRQSLFKEAQSPQLPPSVVAIVDAGRWPGLLSVLAAHEGPWLPCAIGRVPQDAYEVLPYIVELESDSPLLEHMVEKLGTQTVLFALLRRPLSNNGDTRFFSFFEHFCRLPQVRLAPRGRNAWMRLYDPVIFSDFMDLASPAQLNRLFGMYVDEFVGELFFEKTLRHYPCPFPPPDVPPTSPLLLDESQQEALADSYARRFIHTLSLRVAAQQGLSPDRLANLLSDVEHSVNRAEQFGLLEETDIADFVCQDARFHWNLLTDPRIWPLLHQETLEPVTRWRRAKELLPSAT